VAVAALLLQVAVLLQFKAQVDQVELAELVDVDILLLQAMAL